MKRGMVIMAACLMAGAAAAVGATSVGPPVEEGSWSAAFYEDGYSPYAPGNGSKLSFNHIQMKWISGGKFEAPGLVSFSDAGWTSASDGEYVLASGPTHSGTNYLYYSFKFVGSSSSPSEFWYQIWNGTQVVATQHMYWSGSGWSYPYVQNSTWNEGRLDSIPDPPGPLTTTPPVPEPLTMASAFLAISGLGVYVRRRIRVQAAA